jgi:hypothetical protein
MLERSWIALQLTASQEGLSSVKSVIRKEGLCNHAAQDAVYICMCSLIHTHTDDALYWHPVKCSCSQI